MTDLSSQGLSAQSQTTTPSSPTQRILSWCSSCLTRLKSTNDHIALDTPLPEVTDQLALRVMEIKKLIAIAHNDHTTEAHTLVTAQEYYRSAIAVAVDTPRIRGTIDSWNIKAELASTPRDVEGTKRQISTEFATSAGFSLERFFNYRENAARDYERALKKSGLASGPLI